MHDVIAAAADQPREVPRRPQIVERSNGPDHGHDVQFDVQRRHVGEEGGVAARFGANAGTRHVELKGPTIHGFRQVEQMALGAANRGLHDLEDSNPAAGHRLR